MASITLSFSKALGNTCFLCEEWNYFPDFIDEAPTLQTCQLKKKPNFLNLQLTLLTDLFATILGNFIFCTSS